jgi:hypothetical protein
MESSPFGQALFSSFFRVLSHKSRVDVVDVVGDDVVSTGRVEGQRVVQFPPVRVNHLGHQVQHRVQLVCNKQGIIYL